MRMQRRVASAVNSIGYVSIEEVDATVVMKIGLDLLCGSARLRLLA
jgi:hypothetical protein